jgi:L-alanine-DL-glutamate epimerase-like enolase superfamily enzyme
VGIDSFRVWRLTVPAGRVIGDCSCAYDRFSVVAVQLHVPDTDWAWGYCSTASDGTFARPAWFIEPMAGASELTGAFDESWWPRLRGADPEILPELPLRASRFSYLDSAVRNALWDLRAKRRGVPLYQLLATLYGDTPRPEVPAYGSLLDFPLSDADAAALARQRASDGFRLLKVKVGADNPNRDLERVRLIRAAAGELVDVSGDANEAWSAPQAAETLDFLRRGGVPLAYIEDPLPAADLAGFAELARTTEVPLHAHDYLSTIEQVEQFCAQVPLACLRASSDAVDFPLACCLYAREHGLQVSIGNSFGELGVHVAAAFSVVRHMEFSGLAWSQLLQDPVRVRGGNVIPPAGLGAGLDPRPDQIERLASRSGR